MNRAALMRALRANAVAAGALIGIVLLASAVGGYILAHQRLNPPGWVPVVGESPSSCAWSWTRRRASCPARARR